MTQLPELSRLAHEEKDALTLARWVQVQTQTARVAGLEAKVGAPTKTSDNSSLPASQGKKPDRAERAGRSSPRQGSLGRKDGGRALAAEPDEIVSVRPVLYAREPTYRAPLEHAQGDVERLRHLLWNGREEDASEALGRIARWAEDASLLTGGAVEAKARRLVTFCTELHAEIANNEDVLIDYGERYRAGKPISTSPRAEGTINHLVNARMNKRKPMRWSPFGAHRVLQVRATVLDGRFGLGQRATLLAAA